MRSFLLIAKNLTKLFDYDKKSIKFIDKTNDFIIVLSLRTLYFPPRQKEKKMTKTEETVKLKNPEYKAFTAFGGSREGTDPIFLQEAEKVAKKAYEAGFKYMLYGGSNAGVMGKVAEVFAECGGTVIEITDDYFAAVDESKGHKATVAKHKVVAKDLQNRKNLLIDGGACLDNLQLSDKTPKGDAEIIKKLEVVGCIALPGGVGTYDEILSTGAINQQDSLYTSSLKKEKGTVPKKPFVLLNTKGIFNPVKDIIKHCSNYGFASEERDLKHFNFVDTAEEAVQNLVKAANIKEAEMEQIKQKEERAGIRRKILGQDREPKEIDRDISKQHIDDVMRQWRRNNNLHH